MVENVYESPKSELATDINAVNSPTLKDVLFSFKGRIKRLTYWKAMIGMYLVFFLLAFLAGAMQLSEDVIGGLMLLLYIPLIWISLAVQVKRWHDRDKSGWFVLVGLIPVIGPIWAFIENGCLAGDESANRFGPPEA